MVAGSEIRKGAKGRGASGARQKSAVAPVEPAQVRHGETRAGAAAPPPPDGAEALTAAQRNWVYWV